MSEQTYILGKTQSLENTLHNLQSQLKAAGFEMAQAPLNHPVANIYSLHIFDQRLKSLFTNGKGVSEKACQASAYAEFVERLASNYFFSDFYLGERDDWLYFPNEKAVEMEDFEQLLTPELWRFYAQEASVSDYFSGEDFVSINDDSDWIRALPLVGAQSQECVYFPMNLLSNLYASNGLAAGNCQLEARIQGMSEVFERWVKNQIMRNNWCLPEVPESEIAGFDAVLEARQALRAQGIEVSIRDGSLGGRYPVICVLLFEQAKGTCFASFGAHPVFEVALERTLTESLQGRHLESLDGFQRPIFDSELVASDENIENHFIDSSGFIHSRFVAQQADFDFAHWPVHAEMEAQWQWMNELIAEQGTQAYIADYEQHNFSVCRIVVPGMSEVYPLAELVDNNQNQGRYLRQCLYDLEQTQDDEELFDNAVEDLLALLDEFGFSDHQGVANLIGLLPQPGSFWQDLNIAQLKFWLLLALQDWEEALESLEASWAYLSMENSLYGDYQCYRYVLQMMQAYAWSEQAFEQNKGWEILFDAQVVSRVMAHLQAQSVLMGADLGEAMFEASEPHQQLWSIYESLRDIKLKEIA